jgi:hypothetical protein
MKRFVVIICAFLLIASPELFAQTTTTTGNSGQTTTLADNASTAAMRERAPATIVSAARARHLALRDARLSAQRSGDNSNLMPEELAANTSTSGSLLGSLLGGASGSLISTLLGGGSSAATNTNPSSGGTSTGSGSLSNLPPEVLQMLTSFGINLSDLQKAKSTQTAGETASKTGQTSQTSTTTTTTTTPFVTRWANAMLSTVFSSLTLAIQSTSFVNLVKDAFRPLFGLPKSGTATSKPSSMLMPRQSELKRLQTGGVEGRYCSAFS